MAQYQPFSESQLLRRSPADLPSTGTFEVIRSQASSSTIRTFLSAIFPRQIQPWPFPKGDMEVSVGDNSSPCKPIR